MTCGDVSVNGSQLVVGGERWCSCCLHAGELLGYLSCLYRTLSFLTLVAGAMACSTKWPPKLENEEFYENWKKDILIWCDLSELAKPKQALAIHLSLFGRAREASSEIPADKLKQENGVEVLLRKLDELFLVDKGRRQFTAFHELYNLRKPTEMTVRNFVSKFEHVYFKFSEQGMTLPDAVRAFMLLSSCNLCDSEQQLAMSAVIDVNYSNMKSALCRIFGSDISVPVSLSAPSSGVQASGVGLGSVNVKTEPVFLSGDGLGLGVNGHRPNVSEDRPRDEVLYVGRGRPWAKSGMKRDIRGRGTSQNTGRGYDVPRRDGDNRPRRQNPLGSDGRVSRCAICGSKFHWARECPDSYENRGNGPRPGEKMASVEESGFEETVHLSMFLGYAGGCDGGDKLRKLIDEAEGCAVLDSGCSTTVCGVTWLDSYLCELSEFDKDKVTEDVSSSTFTFADGVTVPSIRRVTLPCCVGGVCGTLVTDVVQCSIPLLLSKCSMKKARMMVNFETDEVTVCGKVVKLRSSSSGHYLLPISA